MCGRFDIDARHPKVKELLEKLSASDLQPKLGEVFPGDNALVIKGKNKDATVSSMMWGFPKSRGKGLIFNARGETALEKSFFSHNLKNFPVAVPINGFYEWKLNDAGKKEKFRFGFPDNELFFLAGFSKNFLLSDYSERFAIITREANTSVAPYHNRMPVILKDTEIECWLSGEKIKEYMFRTPFELMVEK